MMAAVKPHAQRAESITEAEAECHRWIGRLAMCLAVCSHEMAPHLRNHVRKTLGEFLDSGAAGDTLALLVREEMER